MRALVVAIVLFAAGVARADGLEDSARALARRGECARVLELARFEAKRGRLRATFTSDPDIATCLPKDIVVGERSPSAALAWSLVPTLAGLGLIAIGGKTESGPLEVAGVTGLVVGPSLGHVYAGSGWGGLAMRAGGVLAMGVGLSLAFCPDGCGPGDKSELEQKTGAALFYGGGALYVVGMLFEIATAPSAADTYNRTHHITVTPTPTGVALAGRF